MPPALMAVIDMYDLVQAVGLTDCERVTGHFKHLDQSVSLEAPQLEKPDLGPQAGPDDRRQLPAPQPGGQKASRSQFPQIQPSSLFCSSGTRLSFGVPQQLVGSRPARHGHQAALRATLSKPPMSRGMSQPVRMKVRHTSHLGSHAKGLVERVITEPLTSIPQPQRLLCSQSVTLASTEVTVDRSSHFDGQRHHPSPATLAKSDHRRRRITPKVKIISEERHHLH